MGYIDGDASCYITPAGHCFLWRGGDAQYGGEKASLGAFIEGGPAPAYGPVADSTYAPPTPEFSLGGQNMAYIEGGLGAAPRRFLAHRSLGKRVRGMRQRPAGLPRGPRRRVIRSNIERTAAQFMACHMRALSPRVLRELQSRASTSRDDHALVVLQMALMAHGMPWEAEFDDEWEALGYNPQDIVGALRQLMAQLRHQHPDGLPPSPGGPLGCFGYHWWLRRRNLA